MKSKKLRNSARDENCTMNIVGVCNYNPETTILAHLPDESNGMGKKSDDISSCYCCSSCHDVLDRRVINDEFEKDRQWYMRRAQTRTIRKAIEKGIIHIHGT